MKHMVIKSRLFIVPLCGLGILLSLYLPFFTTWQGNTPMDKFRADLGWGLVNTVEIPEGIIKTYNGFGSLYGLFSILLFTILTISIFFFPRVKAIPIIVTILFVIAILFVEIGCSAGFGSKPMSDRILIGYLINIVSVSALIAFAFIIRKKIYAAAIGDLLDN